MIKLVSLKRSKLGVELSVVYEWKACIFDKDLSVCGVVCGGIHQRWCLCFERLSLE